MIEASDCLRHVVDINPHKQGRYISGTGQEIVAPEFLRELRPTKVILMNPNYRREVENQLSGLGIFSEILDAGSG